MSIKEKILAEHVSWGGSDEDCKIKKAPGIHRHYFLYWIDGQIEHRDTYFVIDDRVYLAFAEKRYAPYEKWIKET